MLGKTNAVAGGSFKIGPVTNITLNNKGILNWTAPDTSEIENKGYTATFTYDVYLNGENKCTVNGTSASLYEYLSEGENNIKVIAKAEIKYFKSETETVGTWTSSVAITVVTLNTRLPVVNGFSTAAAINNKAYIFGGRDKNSTYKTILEFDPTTNTIVTLDATFSTGMQTIRAVTIDDKIYIFGYNDVIFEFDPITKTLTTLSVILSNYIQLPSVAVVNNKAYIFCGKNSSGFNINVIEEYDKAANTITTLSATLPNSLYASSAVTINDKIYLFGGRESSYSKKILEFDPHTYTTTTLSATLPIETISTMTNMVHNKAYMIGGEITNSVILNTIVEYDPSTNTVTTLNEKLPTKIGNASTAVINDKFYIFGGQSSSSYNDMLDTIVCIYNLG